MDAQSAPVGLYGGKREGRADRAAKFDIHRERMTGPIAGRRQQPFGLGDAPLERPVGPVGLDRSGEVVHARRHEGIRRWRDALADLVGNEAAVDGHGQGLAHPLVAEGRDIAHVEHQVIDPEIGVQVHIVGDLIGLAQIGDAPALDAAIDVQLAPPHAPLGREGVGGGVIDHAVQADRSGVIETRVLLHGQVVVQLPLGQHIGAGRQVVAGLGPLVAPLGHGRARGGHHGGVLGQLQHIGRRMVQLDAQGAGVDGMHAQGLDRRLAGVHRLAVLDEIEQRGIVGGQFGIDLALHAEHEVVGGDGRSVRPLSIAQMEGPDQAVGRGLPGRGDARHDVALGVVLHQTDHQVVDHLLLPGSRRQGGIKRAGLRAIAEEQALLAGRTGGTRGMRRAGVEQQGNGGEGQDQPRVHLRPFLVLIEQSKPDKKGLAS